MQTFPESEEHCFALTSSTNHIKTDPTDCEGLIFQLMHSLLSHIYKLDPHKFLSTYVKNIMFIRFRASDCLTLLSCQVLGPT